MKKSRFLLLLVIPLIVFIYNIIFVGYQDRFHFSMADPSYAYLLNGLNIANGYMDVGHIDHPGTTVQSAAGIFIRIIYIFSGKEENLSTDLLSDPERYLHVISYIWLLLSCGVMFLCGRKIYEVSGNMLTALFFQSAPLLIFTIITSMSDLRPEGFLAWGGMILVTICFSFIHEKQMTGSRRLLYALKFGVIIAFLIITKVTALPLIIIPVFLLGKWKSIVLYFTSAFAAGIIFLIPALSKIWYFFVWAKGLLFHSGIYGSGKEEIVDPAQFRQGLKYIFSDDTFFLLAFLLMAGTGLYLLITKKITFRAFRADPRLRLLIVIFITAAACTVMVAKHFKYHYLIPGYSLMPLGVYLSFALIGNASSKALNFFQNRRTQLAAFIFFGGGYFFYNLSHLGFFDAGRNPKAETAKFLADYKDIPRLYITYEFYSAEPAPALYFGLSYSGNNKPKYNEIVKKIYPSVFFYSFPEKNFHDWEKSLRFTDILSRNERMLVSFYYTDPYVVQQTLDLLNAVNRYNKVIQLNKIYENQYTGDQVYEMKRIGKVDVVPDSAVTIFCNAERDSALFFLSDDGKYNFQGAESKVTTQAHSGAYSLELNDAHQYGFVFHLPVQPGKQYEVSAWRKSASGRGVIIASGAKSGLYLSSAAVAETGENGWEKVSIYFTVPENFADSEVSVGTWNEGLKEPVYFDDFRIVSY